MKINFKDLIVAVVFILFSQFIFSQNIDSEETIKKMKKDIKEFFINKGEINTENNLNIEAYEITDGSDLGYKKTGIYIIRTVYRTDGSDYLFFKNDKDFSILDFTDLKLLITKTLILLKDKPDIELLNYIKALSRWYEESYLYKKNKRKIKFIKGKGSVTD